MPARLLATSGSLLCNLVADKVPHNVILTNFPGDVGDEVRGPEASLRTLFFCRTDSTKPHEPVTFIVLIFGEIPALLAASLGHRVFAQRRLYGSSQKMRWRQRLG